jgi:hypothetical protein
MATTITCTTAPAYQLRVTLEVGGGEPPIWRTLVVPSDITLSDLHKVLQIAMGWQSLFMYCFKISGVEYAGIDALVPPIMPANKLSPLGWLYFFLACFSYHYLSRERTRLPKEIDVRKLNLSSLVTQTGSAFIYEYNLSYSWRHKIVLEQIVPVSKRLCTIRCLAGQRACPPECVHCTGMRAYRTLINQSRHAKHFAWGSIRETACHANFNPDAFSLRAVNAELRELSRSLHSRIQIPCA